MNKIRLFKLKGVSLLLLALLATLAVFGLSGCADKSAGPGVVETQADQTEKEEGDQGLKIKIYASIYPLYNFAQAIGGDLVDVNLVVPPGTEAHDFEPAAKLVGAISEADMLIYNGLGLEHWIDNMLGSLGEGVKVVNTSEGIETIGIEEATSLDHNHDHDHDAAEGEDHAHEPGSADPHVWLDPQRAKMQADGILKALIAISPENEAAFNKNYQALVVKFDALDKAFEDGLKDSPRKDMVVGHAAFSYLADRYKLHQLAIAGISPMEEPSAAQLGELTELIKEHEIKVIFYEVLASPKLSEVLAQETGTKTAVLNPLEGLTQEQIDAGDDYFSEMEKNLEALKSALFD